MEISGIPKVRAKRRSSADVEAEKKAKERRPFEKLAKRMGAELEPAEPARRSHFGFEAEGQDSDCVHCPDEGCPEYGPIDEMEHTSPPAEFPRTDVELFSEQVSSMYLKNNSVPPFLEQAPTNVISSVAFPMPGWNAEKREITTTHMYITGFAEVAVQPSEEEGDTQQLQYVLFCNCCEEGQNAWHQVELFHDLSGCCTSSSKCIHARCLDIFVDKSDGGYKGILLRSQSAGIPHSALPSDACNILRSCNPPTFFLTKFAVSVHYIPPTFDHLLSTTS